MLYGKAAESTTFQHVVYDFVYIVHKSIVTSRVVYENNSVLWGVQIETN